MFWAEIIQDNTNTVFLPAINKRMATRFVTRIVLAFIHSTVDENILHAWGRHHPLPPLGTRSNKALSAQSSAHTESQGMSLLL